MPLPSPKQRRFKRAAILLALSGLCWIADFAMASDFLAANMDRTVQPGKDFFQYANGGWLKRNPIPPAESHWGIGKLVQEQLYARLRKINEDAAAGVRTAGSDAQKIGDFWSTGMDAAKAEQLGAGPLAAELARIDAIQSTRDALDVAFSLHELKLSPLLSFSVNQDERNSGEMTIHLWQGGLGMPERDFYLKQDQDVAAIRKHYQQHIARTLVLLGRGQAEAQAAARKVLAFETGLAKVSRSMEALRDPVANYHQMAPAEVSARLTPSIDWTARLAAWNLRPASVIVGQPAFYRGLEALLAATAPAVLQDYLRMQLVDGYGDYLSQAYADEVFSFSGAVLNGQKEQRPRWKRVLDAEQSALGMVVGRIYVKDNFSEASRQRYTDMVEAIRAAYLDRINALDWMSEPTKAKARAKLAAMKAKVGYPTQWKDDSALAVGTVSYADNMKQGARWLFQDMLSKYGKPVERGEWDMTPQTYNAYYSDSNNEIALPAAIFMILDIKDEDLDDAVVYGYTGASTIGHEITHGFDDQGRQFDAAGNLVDWWTPQDAARFKQRAAVMVKQFNNYKPLPGMRINGQSSLGENIADYGGVLLGIEAFKKTAQYKEGKLIGGLTPMQRYFLGYSLAWMTHQRDAVLRRDLLSDVHAPSKWRVLGSLSNIPEFYQAFGIKPGQPMYRKEADRVKIW